MFVRLEILIYEIQKINNIYGDGSAAESIVNILQSEKFCCQKEFVDIKKTSWKI